MLRKITIAGIAVILGLTATSAIARTGPIPVFGDRGYAVMDLAAKDGHLDGFRIAGSDSAHDGSITILTTRTDFEQSGIRLIRLRPDGTRDVRFGNGGSVVRYMAADFNFTPNALTIDSRGRAVVALTLKLCDAKCPVHAAAMRFRKDGELDGSFGRKGMFRSPQAGTGQVIRSLPGGKTLISGVHGHRFLAWRVDRDGRLDHAFGRRGTGSIPEGPIPLNLRPGRATEMTVDGRGRIVVMGIQRGLGDSLFFVRFGPDGRQDTNFGDRGVRRARHAGANGGPVGLVEVGGRIITSDWRDGCSPLWALRSGTGNPDAGFNSPQPGIECDSDGASAPAGIDLDPDGNIVIFNYVRWPSPESQEPRFTVARYFSDGTLDPGFGDGGHAPIPVSTGGLTGGFVDSQGRPVTTGRRNAGRAGFVVRMKPDGSPDHGFG
ncbi:MAG: hypothetical protein M3Y45_08520, partial [Actinomycetota bacterium]|nr:hypothetical protein [Actinomycetota bacterium]